MKFYLHYGNLFFFKILKGASLLGNKKLFPKKKLPKTFTNAPFLVDLFYNKKRPVIITGITVTTRQLWYSKDTHKKRAVRSGILIAQNKNLKYLYLSSIYIFMLSLKPGKCLRKPQNFTDFLYFFKDFKYIYKHFEYFSIHFRQESRSRCFHFY